MNNLWEENLYKAFEATPKSDTEILMSILTIIVFNRFGNDLGHLYKIVGMEKFSKISEVFSEKTLRFPEANDLRQALVLALSYYYRNIKHMSWEDTQRQLPYEKDLPLHMGKRLVSLDRAIKQQLDDLLEGK